MAYCSSYTTAEYHEFYVELYDLTKLFHTLR